MIDTVEIRALLVTPDPDLVSRFSEVCEELGLSADSSATPSEVPVEISCSKYEAVLVDFDTVPKTPAIMDSVRESRGNKTALIFAVATATAHRHQALRQGANFIFVRPLDSNEIRRVLYAAYDLMARESRRYFRFSVELPILLGDVDSEPTLGCTTFNISSNGMALRSPIPLRGGQMVQMALFIPGAGQPVRATGSVIWDDQHGKTGINFQCAAPRDQNELDAWLNARFYELLRPKHLVL